MHDSCIGNPKFRTRKLDSSIFGRATVQFKVSKFRVPMQESCSFEISDFFFTRHVLDHQTTRQQYGSKIKSASSMSIRSLMHLRRKLTPGVGSGKWRAVRLPDFNSTLWVRPGAFAEDQLGELKDFLQARLRSITETLQITDPQRVRLDIYLHSAARITTLSKNPVYPGTGLAGIVPVFCRPFIHMFFGTEYNLRTSPEGVPSFRDVASNELVKACLLSMLATRAYRAANIGWIEEGIAAYLQSDTFDGQPLHDWAKSLMDSSAQLSVASLMRRPFDPGKWSESDQVIFDLMAIRLLGSFWSYWIERHGMRRFLEFYAQVYEGESWVRKLFGRTKRTTTFEKTYQTTLEGAEAEWRSHIKSLSRSERPELAEVVTRADAAFPHSRWADPSKRISI